MKLLSIEWMKLKRLNTFKVILAVYALVVPLMYYLLSLFTFGPIVVPKESFMFPGSYETVTWVASFFNLMIGVILVVFTCNELKYKTQRQNVIDGLSKKDVILSKFYVVLMMSTIITAYTFVLAVTVGAINDSISNMMNGIHFIALYWLQTTGYFIFAFFFANLIKNSALAIVLYLLSTIIEGIIGMIIAKDYLLYFPLTSFANLIPFPSHIILQQNRSVIMGQAERSFIVAIYVTLFVLISYWILKKRDV